MIEVGDKVIVLPFDELDKAECEVEGQYVCGIWKTYYDECVGKEYMVRHIDTTDGFQVCQLVDDEFRFIFPIGCLKKL